MKHSTQPTWVVVCIIAPCAVAFWTGTAEGAWCTLSLRCLAYIPVFMFSGSLFVLPALLVATLVVLALTVQPGGRVRPMPITPLSLTLLFIFHALLGVGLGAALFRGQGP
jgi:hypothetical protein